ARQHVRGAVRVHGIEAGQVEAEGGLRRGARGQPQVKVGRRAADGDLDQPQVKNGRAGDGDLDHDPRVTGTRPVVGKRVIGYRVGGRVGGHRQGARDGRLDEIDYR